jgi:hypothetical protein
MREIETRERGPHLQFAIIPRLVPYTRGDEIDIGPAKNLTLEFSPIMKGHRRIMWLCTAADPEAALLLRTVFLPGQNYEVQQIEREAFAKGVLLAMGVR